MINTGRNMFPLFELARLLNFANDSQKTDQTVTVRQYAWKEVGERSFLALLFSNGYLLFRHATHGRMSVCRQLPWYTDRAIQSMTFDPSATWLLCISTKEVLYIVPALTLLDNRAQVTQPWKTDDITKIRYRKKRGLPICLTWWHTFNGEEIAVIGTKLGFVVFVDLKADRVVTDSDVNEQVSNIELLQNDDRTTTHALVTTKSNTQWKILLETRDDSKGSFCSDSVEALGYDTIDQNSLSTSILHDSETRGLSFQPLKCQQFSTATFVAPLHIKGRNLVAARDLHKKLFQIYDTSMDRLPLYVYTIPETVNDVIMTDRLLFFTSTEETSFLEIVATQLSEASTLENRQDFNKEAVLQRFRLKPEERIITAFKRTYPFYWHEKLEEENSSRDTELKKGFSSKRSSSPFRISSHTVLDGCIILTTQNIYECRPRVSPEALFVDLAVTRSDHPAAETLAIALGLDVNALYYLAAQLHLCHQDYSQAARFFQLAKCPHVQRVGAFAQYGCMSEVLRYLQQTLSSHLHELKRNEGYSLSSMAVLAFIQQLLEDKSRTNELTHEIREFLMHNKMYDSQEAAELLVTHGFYDLALDMGKARNCMLDVLIQVYAVGGGTEKSTSAIARDIPPEEVHKLLNSTIAHHLSPSDVVHLLQEYRPVAVNFMTHFQLMLGDLDKETLLSVTKVFDISHPVYRNIINFSEEKPRRPRLESTSSVDSNLNGNNPLDVKYDKPKRTLQKLIETFAKCVILLNHHLENGDLELGFGEDGFSPPYSKIGDREKVAQQYHLEPRQRIFSAGNNDSAMVYGGKLYVWGEAFEDERTEEGEEKGSPQLWHPYSPHSLRTCHVTSVTCGAHHSLVNTNMGVYSWGDNRYGQLGLGTMGGRGYCGPQRVSGLEDVFCVDIACGHYHTMLLTDDCKIYSWGWGVHGQLGHGDVTDRPTPEIISFCRNQRVCDIAAGYGHSMMCTDTGNVYAWGSGIFGQLGNGTTCKQSLPSHIATLKDVCSVATKDFHCLALTREGEVYQWGASPNQLCFMVKDQRQARMRGFPTPTSDQLERHLIPRLVNIACVGAKIVRIECGGNFCALLTEDGEVFTWGKNYDGQLGIGNRNEQKIPVIVNRINDRKVAAVACGGDHMVVMDTECLVWAWGRNDFGQLAVVTSQGPCPSGGGQGIYVSMGIYAAVWPVKIPSLNKITAAIPAKSLPLRPIIETAGKWVTVLPKLHPYTCDTLFKVLQYLTTECDPALWLQMCLDYKLQVTAGSLALYQGALPLALHCHLEVCSLDKLSDTESKSERLGCVAEFYLRKLEENDECYDGTHIQMVQEVICQLADAWLKEGCSINSFTQVISRHLPNMSWALFLLLMRSTESQSLADSSEKNYEGKEMEISASPLQLPALLVSKLSTPFCLEVTSCVVQSIQDDKIPRAQASLLCPFLSPGPELVEERRLISTEKLWDEIFQNLRKDSASHSEILLTQNDVVNLTAKEPEGTTEEMTSDDAVLFSCGHHLSRRNLLEDIVPELEHVLVSMSLPQSAVFFGSHFRQQGSIATACPRCVLMSIKNS